MNAETAVRTYPPAPSISNIEPAAPGTSPFLAVPVKKTTATAYNVLTADKNAVFRLSAFLRIAAARDKTSSVLAFKSSIENHLLIIRREKTKNSPRKNKIFFGGKLK